MNQDQSLKELVKEKYGAIADTSHSENVNSCCGVVACCTPDGNSVMAEGYEHLEGYHADADLGLGCGIPTEYAHIKEGQTVIDLGSGAGNDAFVARRIVGEGGKVIGVDFTEKMINRARTNADKLGYNNVEFRLGDIEQLPVTANKADVVISNCVLNLVPNKKAVFAEIFRVLKPGAHFTISDIVLEGSLPEGLVHAAEMYAGCVSGAIQKQDYLSLIEEAGFQQTKLYKQRNIELPDELLAQYLPADEVKKMKADGGPGILSITVYAEKPCCVKDGSCC
jgi:arsenite methyltransferase